MRRLSTTTTMTTTTSLVEEVSEQLAEIHTSPRPLLLCLRRPQLTVLADKIPLLKLHLSSAGPNFYFFLPPEKFFRATFKSVLFWFFNVHNPSARSPHCLWNTLADDRNWIQQQVVKQTPLCFPQCWHQVLRDCLDATATKYMATGCGCGVSVHFRNGFLFFFKYRSKINIILKVFKGQWCRFYV